MPSSTQRRRRGHGEVVPPSSKLDRIGDLLKIMVETFPQKELTTDEVVRWEQDLGKYETEAIEFAFECFRTSGLFFPVPAQIIDICKTWEPPTKYKPGCDAVCLERHGKGYGENDVLWFLKAYTRKREQVERKLTPDEVKGVLDELDKQRGWSPEWRVRA